MTIKEKKARLLLSVLSLLSIFLFLAAASSSAEARAARPLPSDSAPDRVRLLDYENGSAAGLLFLELDKSMSGPAGGKPAWHSLDSWSVESLTTLADDTASGVYDLVITGDEAFVKELENRGALLKRMPIFRSELILLGPPKSAGGFSGGKATEIMKQVFSASRIFFTPMNNVWITAQETALWREAGVPTPGANVNYVEAGREGLNLLLQVEEEGGYTLETAGTFAQYLTSTREPEPLEKLAGTGIYRTHYLCLIDHKGIHEKRRKNAEKLTEWLFGKDAPKLINGFSLAGIKPFEFVRGADASP